jgi:hypothetical protein
MLRDLQEKLPFLNKKKSLEELDSESFDEGTEVGGTSTSIGTRPDQTAKTSMTSLKSRQEMLDDMEEEGSPKEDADAKKKKIRTNAIRGAIVLALVFIIAQDYIFPPEPEVTAPVLKPRQRPVKKKTDIAVEDTSSATTPAPEETSVAATEPVTETPSEPTAETVTDAPAPVEAAPSEVIEEPSTAPRISDVESDTSGSTTLAPEGEPASEPSPAFNNEVVSAESSTSDSITGDTSDASSEDLTEQILTGLEKEVNKNQNTTTKKTEYVAPPDYEYQGRGLVYNCSGKHWACVDGPSYKACEENASSNEFLKKKTECHPFNIYESPRGCASIQNRMVSSNAKTSFCN